MTAAHAFLTEQRLTPIGLRLERMGGHVRADGEHVVDFAVGQGGADLALSNLVHHLLAAADHTPGHHLKGEPATWSCTHGL
ncbi:hypothetical protein Z951_41170 [Streptomyces sp. PRh5]|nr:hypothetical protein Z951_41170 [Streptomyces sp. PRh5]